MQSVEGGWSADTSKYHQSLSCTYSSDMRFPNERESSGMEETAAFVLTGAAVRVANSAFKLIDGSSGIGLFSIYITCLILDKKK